MSKTKCPFCGSEEVELETPFVELNSEGVYENKKTYCCKSQAANHKYIAKRFDPTRNDDIPTPDDVAKW